jgi:hypothetical protein
MASRSAAALRAVPDTTPPATAATGELIAELIRQHDAAEATVRRTRELLRPLARRWADEKPDGINRRQFTMPSLEQLRRECGS